MKTPALLVAALILTDVYRPGPGTIEVVSRPPAPSAVAGGTGPRSDEVTLRMDDGTYQTIRLRAGSGLGTGDRVEVTSDARVVGR